MVSDYLKRADKYCFQQNFDAAEEEVKKALEVDPKNFYAHAYKDRIQVLRTESLQRQQRIEEERRLQEESLLKMTGQLLQEDYTDEEPSEADEGIGEPSPEVVERYKEKLYEAWRNGALTLQEKSRIEKKRRALKIPRNQHRRLEIEAKMNCYIDAVRAASQEKGVSPLRAGVLEELRKKFNVTLEEHLAVEGRILSELQRKTRKATIMVVDDEADFITSLGGGLVDEGYIVLTARSPEEALQKLDDVIPDLILCDIQFSNSELDGFSIYKRVRKKRDFVTIPFIFVTGLKDERVVQEGLQLGVDDYITKPFTMASVLATIEGKLQRYEELKKLIG